MKKVIKPFFVFFLLWVVGTPAIFAEMTMNQQTDMIKKLQAEGIKPGNVYFQQNFRLFLTKDRSFPQKKLYSSLTGLETHADMYDMDIQDIAVVKLNVNYQYQDMLARERNIIEILYSSDAFKSLDDGVHFYTFDEQQKLQKQASFEAVFELPCYLRVEKRNGKVISIQKRPLASITHYVYDYWDDGNIKYSTLEMYNTQHEVIYFDEAFFDEKGVMTKVIKKNTQTGRSLIQSMVGHDGVYSIDEYFDEKGIKTNHVIRYEKSSRVKNEVLNKKGEVIKTKSREPDEIFDFEQDLDETAPYNKLATNVGKSSAALRDELIKHTIDDNSVRWDNDAINRAIALGLSPNQAYYHQLPFPSFLAERYKNFPHQPPLTLIEAENQLPKAEYSDLIHVELADNYQYKKIVKEKWQQSAISLPIEPFKALENDIYFFVRDENGQLNALDGVEQAVSLPSYIRVEKVMGKIVSILQKTRVQKVSNEFVYNHNDFISSRFTVLESPLLANLAIHTVYEKGNYLPLSQQVNNAQGVTIRTYLRSQEEDSTTILERFTDTGIKTNHIEISDEGEIENRYLDDKGNTLFSTDELADNENPQIYDDLPFNTDGFEMILFEQSHDRKEI